MNRKDPLKTARPEPGSPLKLLAQPLTVIPILPVTGNTTGPHEGSTRSSFIRRPLSGAFRQQLLSVPVLVSIAARLAHRNRSMQARLRRGQATVTLLPNCHPSRSPERLRCRRSRAARAASLVPETPVRRLFCGSTRFWGNGFARTTMSRLLLLPAR